MICLAVSPDTIGHHMTSLLCTLVTAFVGLPQVVFDFFYGLIGLTAPDLTFGIGSLFGCNL